MAYANALDRQFIRDRIKVNEVGCWIWQLSLDRYGYPFLGPGAQERRAHRLSYRVFQGDIGDGLEVDHICYVTNCVNPDHLQLLSRASNMARRRPTGVRAGEGKPTHTPRPKVRTHCARGHEWKSENLRLVDGTRFKCRVCDAEDSRKRRAAGRKARTLTPREAGKVTTS